MSEVKFTRGPWVVDSDIGKKGRVGISASRWAYLAKVVVKMKGLDNISAEGIANAYLIAAAPELYEALTAMSDCLDNIISGNEWGAVEEYLDEARAALAKARGETP